MRNHYRYYQRRENAAWIPIPDDNADAEARHVNAVRLTILSTSVVLGGLDDGHVPKDIKFFGPLYFDIDNKNDLALAIASGNKLVEILTEEYLMEERDISIFLSGSKGVHIIIDPESFGLTRSVHRLPQVYKEMARRLYVPGMDLQPYSLRNAFRLTNVQREDGAYRVQVSALELKTLTVEKYRELCSAPRMDFRAPRKSGKLYTQLSVLFDTCTETAKQVERGNHFDVTAVEVPVLRENFATEAPACMLQLADGARAEAASFNSMAVQVAIFAAKVNPDGLSTFRPVFDRIADNQKSTEYSTSRSRLEHMQGQYSYMRHTPKYGFSCAAIRAVIKDRSCCADCPIYATKIIETPADAAKEVGIQVRPDGYFDIAGKSPRRISTFVIEPRHVFIFTQENGQQLRLGTAVNILVNGQNVGETVIQDAAWNNRTAFLKCLQGLGNVSFLGSENDIQKLKFMILSDSDLPEKTATSEMGMHISLVKGKEIRTYVEYGVSLNNLKMSNTYVFEGQDSYRPYLMSCGLPPVSKENTEVVNVITDLLKMNEPHVMGLLVGWAAACHLKEHMMHLYQKFPLVNLWGNQGSGKTTLARFACAVGGTDMLTQHRELSASLSTSFALLTSISNSRSHPVLWDELNRSGNRISAQNYAKAVEYLKACFNGHSIQKGMLGTGVPGTSTGPAVRSYFALRPVIYCSEQEPDSPALLERTISLFISKNELNAHKGMDMRVSANITTLKQIAVTLMLQALNTPTKQVAEKFEPHLKLLPDDVPPRVAYGLAICSFGLEWFETVMATRDVMTDELKKAFERARDAIRSHAANLAQQAAENRIRGEADKVFAHIFDILHLTAQARMGLPGVRAPLAHLQHFITREAAGRKYLYLDVRAAHSAYLEWSRQKGLPVVLDEVHTFAKLAKQEDYVVQVLQDPGLLNNKVAFQIDMTLAKERGLPTYYVWEACDPSTSPPKAPTKNEDF